MPMQPPTTIGIEWLIALCFIALDVLIGTCKAWAKGEISSKVARQGVMHKMGFIGALALCTLIDFSQRYLDLGFSVPTLAACVIMVSLCECYSIMEHIQDMNPDINLRFLKGNDEEKRGEHSK